MSHEKFKNCILKYVLLGFILLIANAGIAQNNDSIPPKDTLRFYKKIKKMAYRHRLTKDLYHAIFVDPAPRSYEEKPLSDQQKTEDPNAKFVGTYTKSMCRFMTLLVIP